MLVWVFQAIIDQLKAGNLKIKVLSVTTLFGSAGNGGGKGWVDLWMLKHDMLYYLTKTSTMQKFCFPVEQLSQIDKVLQNFSDYRSTLSPHPARKQQQDNDGDPVEGDLAATQVPPEASSLDLTWQSGWTAAALRYLNFCEDLVYGSEFYSILRTACRGGKGRQHLTSLITQLFRLD